MKTLKKIEVKPIFLTGFIPPKNLWVQNEVYISREYNTAVHLCLCGCNGQVVTPLCKGEWTLTEKDGKITLKPSIFNKNWDCKSHYVITDNIANVLEMNIIEPQEKKSRCCGRCDGINDICVTDMICEEHDVQGCEICYGPR